MRSLIVLRFFLAALFIISGGEKALGPYQNFLYVVQNYEIFPPFLEEIIARALPWVELFLGIFLLLGLWLKAALRGSFVLFAGFVMVVSQAMVRDLPITECGCFGALISFPLYVVLIFDTTMFFVTLLLIRKFDAVSSLSLDKRFELT